MIAPAHQLSDAKPLRKPEPAKRVAGYLSKYLAKRREDGTLEVTETVRTAGRTLVNYGAAP